MRWVWSLLATLVVLWVIDRLALWAESRGWLYWRRRRGTGGSGAALGDVFLLFQPSRAHVVAEQERQRQTIAYPEDAAPPLGIDLESGTATLPATADDVDPAEGPGSGEVSTPLDGEDRPGGLRP